MESHRRSSVKNKASIKLKQIFWIIISSFFLAFSFYLNSFFSIKNIICYNQDNQECNNDTIQQLNSIKNHSLFFTDFDKKLPGFKITNYHRELPHTLVLELKQQASQWYRLENTKITPSDTPRLDISTNQKISLLIAKLNDNKIKYQELKLVSNVFVVKLTENLRALIDFEDTDGGIYKLTQILQNLELESIDLNIKEIDTRFKMPVLKTSLTDLNS